MQLHYKIEGTGQPLILIHGLFGSLSNLGLLARPLSEDYQVISVDLRNHGLSPQSPRHDYAMLAEDIDTLFEHLMLDRAHIVGHSMGGKVAMAFADRAPDKVQSIAVLDIAPVSYSKGRHDNVFAGLREVSHNLNTITKRSEAESYLAMHIVDPGVRQFLLKSLKKEGERFKWLFNTKHLFDNYHHIMGWQAIAPFTGPTLFIKGQNSEYILPEYRDATARQFPNAKAHMVANTGHWLHAEKPESVYRIVKRFVDTHS